MSLAIESVLFGVIASCTEKHLICANRITLSMKMNWCQLGQPRFLAPNCPNSYNNASAVLAILFCLFATQTCFMLKTYLCDRIFFNVINVMLCAGYTLYPLKCKYSLLIICHFIGLSIFVFVFPYSPALAHLQQNTIKHETSLWYLKFTQSKFQESYSRFVLCCSAWLCYQNNSMVP